MLGSQCDGGERHDLFRQWGKRVQCLVDYKGEEDRTIISTREEGPLCDLLRSSAERVSLSALTW